MSKCYGPVIPTPTPDNVAMKLYTNDDKYLGIIYCNPDFKIAVIEFAGIFYREPKTKLV